MRSNARRVLGFAIAIVLVSLIGFFAHELGHGITSRMLGGKFYGLYVFPGVQVWPNPGQRYDGEWGLNVGMADTDWGDDWGYGSWQDGTVLLMGSGSNLVLAALALGSLWLFRPSGWAASLLLAEALMYIDILLYATLPEWFGWPHWFFFGGRWPEPVDGAEMLGCPRGLFVILVLLVSGLMTWGVIAYVLRYQSRKRSGLMPKQRPFKS